MSCGEFLELYISLTKFQLDIHDRKGVHKNGFFICFDGSNCLVYICRTVCYSLDLVLVIGSGLSSFVSKFSGTFQIQKREFGTFRLGQVYWVNSCYFSFLYNCMLIYVNICFLQDYSIIICIYTCIYTCIYLMYVYFCIYNCFMGIGLNLINMHLFWFLFCSFVCRNSK